MIPTFGNETSEGWLTLVRIWQRRWVRVVTLVVVLALASGTAWYQIIVKPTLTATRLRVWVQGDDRRLTIGIDEEAGLTVVSGGQSGLSQVVVSGDLIFVVADEVGVDTPATWVAIPVVDLDLRFAALAPSRMLAALDVGVKRCNKPTDDATAILGLFLDIDQPFSTGVSVCSEYVGAAADEGEDVMVEVSWVRPDEIAAAPDTSIVHLGDVPDPGAVLVALDQFIAP